MSEKVKDVKQIQRIIKSLQGKLSIEQQLGKMKQVCQVWPGFKSSKI